jgi:hypothetical protein
MKRKIYIGLALLGAALGGCGRNEADVHGCDERQSTGATKKAECVDYENVPPDAVAGLADSCVSVSGGRWVAGGCDHSGAVGGCRIPLREAAPANVTEVQWWWAGAAGGVITDTASARRACASFSGATFIEP